MRGPINNAWAPEARGRWAQQPLPPCHCHSETAPSVALAQWPASHAEEHSTAPHSTEQSGAEERRERRAGLPKIVRRAGEGVCGLVVGGPRRRPALPACADRWLHTLGANSGKRAAPPSVATRSDSGRPRGAETRQSHAGGGVCACVCSGGKV